jgi:hypothetical protein
MARISLHFGTFGDQRLFPAELPKSDLHPSPVDSVHSAMNIARRSPLRCGQAMLERRLLWIREFESSHPSQPVRSLLFDLRLCQYCRHSRGLCWRARVPRSASRSRSTFDAAPSAKCLRQRRRDEFRRLIMQRCSAPIMTDDAGYGVFGTFGGVIPTPALDRIAQAGLRYTQFHSTALCSPTRAALSGPCPESALRSAAISSLIRPRRSSQPPQPRCRGAPPSLRRSVRVCRSPRQRLPPSNRKKHSLRAAGPVSAVSIGVVSKRTP